MLYAIYAYEEMYGGLHGMNNSRVVECASEKDANAEGMEAARDVMESYECIMEDIREEASDIAEEGSAEWEEAVYNMMNENACFEPYPIIDAKGKSITELEDEFYNDKEEFIRTYCQ